MCSEVFGEMQLWVHGNEVRFRFLGNLESGFEENSTSEWEFCSCDVTQSFCSLMFTNDCCAVSLSLGPVLWLTPLFLFARGPASCCLGAVGPHISLSPSVSFFGDLFFPRLDLLPRLRIPNDYLVGFPFMIFPVFSSSS